MRHLVISVGGSLVAPQQINADWLHQFCAFIKARQQDYVWTLVIGGGNLARSYQSAVRAQNQEVSAVSLDLVGIAATQLNAAMVAAMLPGAMIVSDPAVPPTNPLLQVSGGWKPGRSTDFVAVHYAVHYGADVVINLTDIDYVYDQNPRTHADAKPLPRLTWSQYGALVGTDYQPGMHAPFDPVASVLASEQAKSVVLINGNQLERLEQYLDQQDFIGTVIAA